MPIMPCVFSEIDPDSGDRLDRRIENHHEDPKRALRDHYDLLSTRWSSLEWIAVLISPHTTRDAALDEAWREAGSRRDMLTSRMEISVWEFQPRDATQEDYPRFYCTVFVDPHAEEEEALGE